MITYSIPFEYEIKQTCLNIINYTIMYSYEEISFWGLNWDFKLTKDNESPVFGQLKFYYINYSNGYCIWDGYIYNF